MGPLCETVLLFGQSIAKILFTSALLNRSAVGVIDMVLVSNVACYDDLSYQFIKSEIKVKLFTTVKNHVNYPGDILAWELL